jgi:heat-inducible transcriptional repressor
MASESMQQIAIDELAVASSNVERLFQITANSLAQLNRLFGFAILSANSQSKLTDLDLVKLSSGQVLLVVGFKSEKVKTVLLNLSMGIKDSLVEMVASILRERLVGLTVSEIIKTIGDRLRDQSLVDNEIIQVIIENVEDYFPISSEDEIFSSAKDQLWQHPEFSEPDDMQSMIATLDNSEAIRKSVNLSNESESLTIAIGSENPDHSMQSCSVVTKSIVLGESSACFGVIGPTRMNYAEVLTALNLFSSTIDKLSHA